MKCPFPEFVEDPYFSHDWLAVMPATELAVGTVKPAQLMGERLAIWRSEDGEVYAHRDLCIHRGARVSMGKVREDCLICPYHGWEYHYDGSCSKIPAQPNQPIPAKARLADFHCKEAAGMIWVCLGEPTRDPPAPLFLDNADLRLVSCGPYHYQATALRAFENFFDFGHFGFVHEGLLGTPEHAEVNNYKVESYQDGLAFRDVNLYRPTAEGVSEEQFDWYVLRPLTVQLASQGVYSGKPNCYTIFFTVCPLTATKSVGWMMFYHNFDSFTDTEVRDYEDLITYQDIPIVNAQHPELLPTDLKEEIHLHSDRAAAHYRKYLDRLGVRLGVA